SLIGMRAVVISDGRVSWEDRPTPSPRDQELLVRVQAAGLNGADLLQRAGRYPPPPGTPADQPGLECAGVVEQLGGAVTRFERGDRVMSLLAGSGQAEWAVVHERLAMPVPAQVPPIEAGGFPEAFATAYDALFTQGKLAMGERLLVTGAAGGVGLAAVQLGLAAGATVVASVRAGSLHERVAALGAICAGPSDAFGSGPFDVVLELVGGPGLPQALGSLAPWGRVVVIGTGAGARADLDLATLMGRRATIRGSTMRNRTLEEKALAARRLEDHVLPLLAEGRLKVVVEAAFPFEQAQAAYERFAAGGKFGKVVLAAPGDQ
ncbi:MAG: zinc-binding dehydrogenase, partial [Acidimicrobiales bacterium]